MDSFYAQPERVSGKELTNEIELVNNSAVVSGILHSVSGLLAVLDEHRQIVSLNDSFLKLLGVADPAKALGLRPGEALQCVHANDEPSGCGTTKFCDSCGAAVAIVSSLSQNKSVEKICALKARRGGKTIEIALLVKAHPIVIDQKKFLLLFLQDITQQQQRAALERVFFHDVNNMLNMLLGASEMLVEEHPSESAKYVHLASLRLHKEIAIQQCLADTESTNYQAVRHGITSRLVFSELEGFFANHPVAQKKNLKFQKDFPEISFITDFSLLLRVLCNMVINALEASYEHGVVKFWIEEKAGHLEFCVWNAQEIPQKTANRIFQRNFSTKEQAGRGVGTFSMKLFGEEILGGEVSFCTSPNEGTVFRFSHPL